MLRTRDVLHRWRIEPNGKYLLFKYPIITRKVRLLVMIRRGSRIKRDRRLKWKFHRRVPPWSALKPMKRLKGKRKAFVEKTMKLHREFFYNKRVNTVKIAKFVRPKFVSQIVITKTNVYLTKKPKIKPMNKAFNPFRILWNFSLKLNFVNNKVFPKFHFIPPHPLRPTLLFWNNTPTIKKKLPTNKFLWWKEAWKYERNTSDHFYKFQLREAISQFKRFNNIGGKGINVVDEWPIGFEHKKWGKINSQFNHIRNKKNTIVEVSDIRYKCRMRYDKFKLKNPWFIWRDSRFLWNNHYLFKSSRNDIMNNDYTWAYLHSRYKIWAPRAFPVVLEYRVRRPWSYYNMKILNEYNLKNSIRINKSYFYYFVECIRKRPNDYPIDNGYTQELIMSVFSILPRSYWDHLSHWIKDSKRQYWFFLVNDPIDNDFNFSRSKYIPQNQMTYYPKKYKLNKKEPFLYQTIYPYFFDYLSSIHDKDVKSSRSQPGRNI